MATKTMTWLSWLYKFVNHQTPIFRLLKKSPKCMDQSELYISVKGKVKWLLQLSITESR